MPEQLLDLQAVALPSDPVVQFPPISSPEVWLTGVADEPVHFWQVPERVLAALNRPLGISQQLPEVHWLPPPQSESWASV